MGKNKFKYVNKPEKKIDALALATGEELYTDDYKVDNPLYVQFVYSPYAFAKIVNIDEKEALKVEGVIDILSYKNVERIPYTTAGQGYPEPSPYDTYLFDDYVRYVGDKVCAVVAETKEIAIKASKLIKVKYEILKPVLDFEKATESDPVHPEKDCFAKIPVPYYPEKNIAAEINFEIGNIEKGFEESEKLIEASFYTQYTSHAAIEPHAVVTYFDKRGRLVIISTTQVPYHVRRITSYVTKIPISKIRVIKPRIGGGFGGKQEIILEPYAALISWKYKRSCKITLSREEVFTFTRTRHPYRIYIKAGYKSDGTIVSLLYNALENTGAYGSHALTVLSNAGSKVLPLLNKIPNLKFEGMAVYTNLPVGGAYRGYGASQGYAGYGQIIDQIAYECKLDPVDYYKKWGIKTGETSPIFKAIGEGKEGVEMNLNSVGLDKCLDIGAKEFKWKEKREKYWFYKQEGKRFKRGVGMVSLMQGSAIPRIDMASAYMKMNEDGSFNLNVGATDLGTGSDTILAQIAAEVLDIPVEKIIVYSSDTDFTPFDTGAYASSTTYLSGEAVRKCAVNIKNTILKVASEMLEEDVEKLELVEGNVFVKNSEKNVSYEDICLYSLYDKNQFQIQAYASHVGDQSPPPFATHFVEIEVDTLLGNIKVINYLATVDCGTAINPQLAEGQCEGAILNGLSYALTENYYFSDKGTMINNSYGKYKLFSADDMPDLKVILVETYEKTGPFGAKSISEININGPIPAIANAFFHATGKRLYKAPFTPERVLEALGKL